MGWVSSRVRWLLALAAAVAVGVVALLLIAPWESPPARPAAIPPDPRLTYTGPYRNIHPDVKYVGDAKCAECHEERAESYRQHPMGRSIMTLAEADLRDEEKGHGNPIAAFGGELRIDREGDRVFHRELRRDADGKPIYVNSFEVHWVVGSGSVGRSFLTVRDDSVFQTPISWYSSKKIWDVSPGWEAVGGGRPIQKGCLFCHANRVEAVPESRNRYEMPLFRGHAIGCERCHGPGEKHVAGEDNSIVNPAKLEPKLREAVCQQCHLEGEHRVVRHGRDLFDFRPGLPLEEFIGVFVHAEGENLNLVNHVDQMYHSGCFKGGAGKPNQMGCISCHDPHVKPSPAQRVSHYRAACLKCHNTASCSLSETERRRTSAADSCIDCHMPAIPTTDIPHTASTNHAIPRRGRSPASAASHGSGLPIRSFYPTSDDRDLGLALAEMIFQRKIDPRYGRDALVRLDAAPDDADTWEAKAHVLQAMGRMREAAAAYRRTLEHAPNRETAISAAGLLAMADSRHDEALAHYRKIVELNPWHPRYHLSLAQLLRVRGDWAGVRRHSEACLKLDPGNVEGRTLLVEALLQAGERDRARTEFAIIAALKPPNLDEIRRRLRIP